MSLQHHARLTLSRRRAVDRLLDECLTLPETDQPNFLNDCRSRYPRLSRWLDQLVGDSRGTTSVLAGPVCRIADQVVADSRPEASRPLAPGTRLGPWRIETTAGQGGMGRVYRGQRADGAFQMEVAIKLIAFRQAGLADLLRQECHNLARLDHPAVTRLVDAGVTDADEPYLVMEWVPGQDLQHWLDQNSPDLEQRLHTFVSAAEAVVHAHQRLVVHGDIKPANLRIRNDGQLKLMDFGVARLLETETDTSRAFAGLTPSFAAPEQLAGDPASTWSDIWALGALLHWLLTGQNRSGSERSGESGLARWPRGNELLAIIDKACAKQPEERYATVPQLLQDLQRYWNDEPLEAQRISRSVRLTKFLRRHRAPVAAALFVLGLLLTGITVSTGLYLDAEQQRERAEQSRQAALTITEVQQSMLADMHPEQLASGLITGLRDSIRDSQDAQQRLQIFNQAINQTNPTDIMREQLIGRVIEPAESEMLARLGDDPLNLAALRHSLGEVYMRWGMYEPARKHFLAASEKRERLLAPQVPEYHESGIRLFVATAHTGLIDDALAIAEKAVAAINAGLGELHPHALEAAHSRASLFLMRRDPAMAREALLPIIEARRDILGEDHPDTLRSLNNLAVCYLFEGRPEHARPLLESVLEYRRDILGPEHPETLSSLQNLGGLLAEFGAHEQALALLNEAHETRRRLHGEAHPDTLLTLSNLAHTKRLMGQVERALEIESELLDLHIATLGIDHPETLRIQLNRAVSLRELGKVEQAIPELEQVFESRRQTLSAHHPATLETELRMVHAWWLAGRTEEAAERMAQVIRQLEEHSGPVHPETISASGYRALMLSDLEQFESGVDLAEYRLAAMDEAGVDPLQSDRIWLKEQLLEILRQWNAREPDSDRDRRIAELESTLGG